MFFALRLPFHVVYTDRCDSTQFHCSRGNSCISVEQQCDGFTNCIDTSDEAKCCKLQRVHASVSLVSKLSGRNAIDTAVTYQSYLSK